MLSNCGAGEDSWKSLWQQEIKPVIPKGNQPWIFIGRTDAEAEAAILCCCCFFFDIFKLYLFNTLITWWEEPSHWKRPWCWERLRAEEKGMTEDEMVELMIMASPTQRTWVWANSISRCRTEESGVPQSMGSQSQTWLRDWTTTEHLYWEDESH